MNPKLEILRKRFLPPTPEAPPPDTIFSHSPQVSQEPRSNEQPPPADSAESAEPGDALAAESSPQSESLAEQVTENREREIAVDEAKSINQLGQAIDKLFEPAQRCGERLAEIVNASHAFLRLTGSALGLFESLEDFRDHMRKLSNSFASMRAFQDDLGGLAESFEPVRALHQHVGQLAGAVRIRLAEVSSSLEPANALRAQAAELVQILEGAAELQAQFYELSKVFAAFQANGTSVKDGRDETASPSARWRLA